MSRTFRRTHAPHLNRPTTLETRRSHDGGVYFAFVTALPGSEDYEKDRLHVLNDGRSGCWNAPAWFRRHKNRAFRREAHRRLQRHLRQDLDAVQLLPFQRNANYDWW